MKVLKLTLAITLLSCTNNATHTHTVDSIAAIHVTIMPKVKSWHTKPKDDPTQITNVMPDDGNWHGKPVDPTQITNLMREAYDGKELADIIANSYHETGIITSGKLKWEVGDANWQPKPVKKQHHHKADTAKLIVDFFNSDTPKSIAIFTRPFEGYVKTKNLQYQPVKMLLSKHDSMFIRGGYELTQQEVWQGYDDGSCIGCPPHKAIYTHIRYVDSTLEPLDSTLQVWQVIHRSE